MANRFGGIPVNDKKPFSNRFGGVPISGDTPEEFAARQAQISQQIAQEEGPVGAFLSGAGYDLTKVGRGIERMARPGIDLGQNLMAGLGMGEPAGAPPDYAAIGAQAEQEMAPLREAYPMSTGAGELTGAVAGLAPAALLPGGPAASLAARVGTGAGIGAFDMATRTAGEGQNVGDVLQQGATGAGIGAAVEVLFPPIISLASKIIRKITGKVPQGTLLTPGGEPTEELQDALDKSGLSFKDLTDKAKQMFEASSGGEPEAVVRASLFDDLGIPTTQSRISQKAEDFLTERKMARDPGESGKLLNERLAEEALSFNDVAVDLRDQLGLPEEAAEAIREGLESRISLKKEGVDQAYDKLRTLSQGDGIPLFGGNILESLNSEKTRHAAGKISLEQRSKINDLLIEYGIDADPERVLGWISRREAEMSQGAIPVGTEITPLNVLNFSQMQADLNGFLDPMDKPLNTMVGALKDALLKEKDTLYASLKKGQLSGDLGGVGKIATNVMDAATDANTRYIEYSELTNVHKLVGKMVAKKRGTYDMPMIASDAVLSTIMGKGAMGTLENTDMLVRNLQRAGPKGEKALGDLQSFVIADLTNAAIQTNKKLADGVPMWSGAKFKTRMDQIGREKIELIFRNNPSARQQLNKLELASDAIIAPQTVSVSSGTSDDILNALKKSSPFNNVFLAAGGALGLVASGTVASTGAGALASMGMLGLNKFFRDKEARIQLQKTLNASNILQKKMGYIQYRFPNVAAVLGINRLYAGKEEEK